MPKVHGALTLIFILPHTDSSGPGDYQAHMTRSQWDCCIYLGGTDIKVVLLHGPQGKPGLPDLNIILTYTDLKVSFTCTDQAVQIHTLASTNQG